MFGVSFVPRSAPLEPRAVIGFGTAARALAERLLACDEETWTALRGLVWKEALLVVGPTAVLPWANGVSYLGQDPEVPLLLLPTQLRPNVPLDAFGRALLEHAKGLEPPLVVTADPMRVVSLTNARPILRARLTAWMRERP